ncbi:hypothetical protein ATANTOWER_020990 [Ataeniobius toweri]|uniref:Uncharacterized protein n=1 Tax=Ataeniobius toweri TaxID=208326 RepID=A0ABU7BRN9_9TELE|nr:hypothetical protein [Ataeniobius toweri]
MHAPQTIKQRPPGAARQSSRPRDAPPCPLPCPRKRHQPNKPGDAEPLTSMPAKQKNKAKPSCVSPRANATATPHNLPYIGRGTVETTNPKHTPPTRNHPADK